MRIENQTKGTVPTTHGIVANTFFSRLKGLLGSPPLQLGEGLLLVGEKSIHTFLMAFPIDVVYISSSKTVIRLDHALVPNRIGKYVSASAYILELPAGMIDRTDTTIGDQLTFSIE